MCNHEMIGHIEGMLNRDLRTTKSLDSNCARTKLFLRQWQRDTANNSTLAECRAANDVSHVFPRKRKRFQQRSNSYAWNSLQSKFLKSLFTSVYFDAYIHRRSNRWPMAHRRCCTISSTFVFNTFVRNVFLMVPVKSYTARIRDRLLNDLEILCWRWFNLGNCLTQIDLITIQTQHSVTF